MRGRNLKIFEKEPQTNKEPQYRSYGEILDEKRREEKLYRTLNDHHVAIDTEAARNMVKKQLESNVGEMFDWQANVLVEDIVEPVVPKYVFETLFHHGFELCFAFIPQSKTVEHLF